MKKRVSITEHENGLYIDSIVIDNARYLKNFADGIKGLIKSFLGDREAFFGFYRTDGLHLSKNQMMDLKSSIPKLFKDRGSIERLDDCLSTARCSLDDECVALTPSIFDYYLQTVIFSPKVDYETFRRYYSNYLQHDIVDIIRISFADILFFYEDSGDFSIHFNNECYNPDIIHHAINKYLFEQ